MAKKHRKRRVGISARAPEASRRPRALPTVTEALRERFLEARGSLRTPFWRPKREVPTLTKAWPQRIGSTFSGFQRGSRKKERKTTKIQVQITAFWGRNGSRRASQTSPVRPRGPKMASGGGPGTHPKFDEFSGNGTVRKKDRFLSSGCACFYFFFDVFSLLAADPHPRGLETRFGAILVDFGVILGWIWARILSPEKGEFREKILQRPCTKSCRRLGLPHPHAQTLRVRRSRASVFNILQKSSCRWGTCQEYVR